MRDGEKGTDLFNSLRASARPSVSRCLWIWRFRQENRGPATIIALMYIGGLTPISHAHAGGFLDMKDFGYYAALPDSMTIEELNAEFAELLEGKESKKISSDVFVNSLLELSDRQWHTYSVLNA